MFWNYKIALKSYHGKYVVAESNGVVNANRAQRQAWETFSVEELGNNKVALRSVHGKYLCAENGGGYAINANRDRRNAWEEFTVEVKQGGRIAFKTAHGRYMVAESNGRLRADRSVAREWETFLPECI